MTDAVLAIDTQTGRREVRLGAYLHAASDERAICDAHAWIKRLRHADVQGQPLRRRFTFRGDSLWWFAELYLHKEQVVLNLFRTIAALEALVMREHPTALAVVEGGRLVRGLAPQVARAHGITWHGPQGFGPPRSARLAALRRRAWWLTHAALLSRLRPRRRPRGQPSVVVAFVHRAFWRNDVGDGSAEAYIGPVLQALQQRLEKGGLTWIGVGPSSNFRARRWWHALRRERTTVVPVEAYVPLRRLQASRAIWRARHATTRALWESRELRDLSVIQGCDCWPVIREELAGIAWLQWPWSARAMDEAAAALDASTPSAVVTYAEAGGWGRALMLECRRRGIPGIGLQHGFISRHWLNYLHEPDEMAPDPESTADRGFPHPTLTLVYDRYAAQHLVGAGRFPEASLTVTGSPRLDDLVRAARAIPAEGLERARAAAGAGAHALILVATKHREAKHVLPRLLDAAAGLSQVLVAIKTHPAETPAVYERLVAGRTHVTVLPASAALAPLLRACRTVVTVNSTVALDAAVLDVPALVIGMPNNLSPFVEAGALAGETTDGLAADLRRILYDEEFRRQLGASRRAFLARFGIGSDGTAADRAADAIMSLARRPRV